MGSFAATFCSRAGSGVEVAEVAGAVAARPGELLVGAVVALAALGVAPLVGTPLPALALPGVFADDAAWFAIGLPPRQRARELALKRIIA